MFFFNTTKKNIKYYTFWNIFASSFYSTPNCATSYDQLAQLVLRSGYSKLLDSHLFRINGSPIDNRFIIPFFLGSPDVFPWLPPPLFNCRENQTHLTVIDLRTKPRAVALFFKPDEPDWNIAHFIKHYRDPVHL